MVALLIIRCVHSMRPNRIVTEWKAKKPLSLKKADGIKNQQRLHTTYMRCARRPVTSVARNMAKILGVSMIIENIILVQYVPVVILSFVRIVWSVFREPGIPHLFCS